MEKEGPCLRERDAVKKLKKTDYDEIDLYSYVATFKIYSDTTFEQLKAAACKFWLIEENSEFFVLTDEYFNNLSTYKDTIQHFFSDCEGYMPLDKDVFACCYLIRKNNKMVNSDLHPLQHESYKVIDENKKDDDED